MTLARQLSAIPRRTLEALSGTELTSEPYEIIKFNDEPKIPTYGCQPSQKAREKYKCFGVFGQGSSMMDELAKIKAAAECLERMAIYNPNVQSLVKSKFNGNEYAAPELFSRDYEVKQLIRSSKHPSLKSSTYYWMESLDVLNGSRILIPAQAVYISRMFNREHILVKEQITTGTALGKTHVEAYQRGLLEVIERDSFMLHYLNKSAVKKIVEFPKHVNELIEYLRRYQIETYIFDITTDINVATFMTIAVDRTGLGPAITVGLKAGFDNEETAIASILEAVQSRRISRIMKELRGSEFKLPTKDDLNGVMSRYYYWYPRRGIRYLSFWLDCDKTVKFDELPTHLKSFREAETTLSDKNYHIFAADITLDEIDKAGFKVVKTLVPELHPLYISEDAKVLHSVHGGHIKPADGLKPHPFA